LTGGVDAHAVDAFTLQPFPGSRPDLIVDPKATNRQGFKRTIAQLPC